jgi:cytochrome c-type biogenesis protein CcmH/NrfG
MKRVARRVWTRDTESPRLDSAARRVDHFLRRNRVKVNDQGNPIQMDAWYQRGEALRRAGHLEEAVASFDHAIRLKPDDFRAWHGRARALAELERYFDAVACYSTAMKLKPNRRDIRRERAIAITKLRRYRLMIASQRPVPETQPCAGSQAA